MRGGGGLAKGRGPLCLAEVTPGLEPEASAVLLRIAFTVTEQRIATAEPALKPIIIAVAGHDRWPVTP